MSNNLSSWFSSMRSNESESEIDGPLTSDLDSTFLSLDMTHHPFNISSESLLMPLSVCKTEGSSRSSCAKRKMVERSGSCSVQLLDGTAVTENTSPTILTSSCSHYLPASSPLEPHGQLVNLIECGDGFGALANCPQFQYILMAPTSPATKLNEETLTYLNQGHSYEIKLKKFENSNECDGVLYRSVVRVVFHERRLQFMEREQLETWKQTRPGERLMDIDIPLSYGLVDVRIDPQDLNCVDFVWDPRRDAGVFIKVHCISTEFTAKKHGGEKGVSFRVQLETYQQNMKPENYQQNAKESSIIHCASCQVKVFKPKGADRKLKTDREKMEKKTETEKEKFQPPFEYTVMTDVPVEQVCFYLDQLNRQSEEKTRPAKLTLPQSQPRTTPFPANNRLLYSGSQPLSPFYTDLSNSRNPLRQNSNNFPEDAVSRSQALLTTTGDCCQGLVDSSSFDTTRSPGTPSSTNSSGSSSSTVHPGGPLSPSATESEVAAWLAANRFNHLMKRFQNFAGNDILRLNRSDLIDICGTSDGIRLMNALTSKNVVPVLTLYVSQKPEGLKGVDHEQSVTESCFDAVPTSTPLPLMSPNNHNKELCLRSGDGSNYSVHSLESKRRSCLTAGFSKRQLYSTNEEDGDSENQAGAKRRCLYDADTVYNAIYLSCATSQHLLEQLAAVQKLSVRQIRNFHLSVSSGVVVHVTDSVVENLRNGSKFYCEINSDGGKLGFDLLLTPVSSSSSS